MTGNGSPLDGIGRFSIVSLSFRVCAKANVGLMRAAPTPAASRKKLVRDKSLISKDFKLRRIVKRFLGYGRFNKPAERQRMKAIRIQRQPLAGDGSKSGKSDHFRKGCTTRAVCPIGNVSAVYWTLKVAKFGKIASRLQPTAPPGAPAH